MLKMKNKKQMFTKDEIRILKEERLKFKDVGRNDICLCGSGKKYKKCCGK